MSLLLLYLALALGVSFLCSLLEAGLLSVPRGHLGTMVDQGKHSGLTLQRMKDNIDRPLSAILTLNTVAHTVGAAGVGAQAQVVFGKQWVAVASAVLTLLILLFSEIVPKTLGAVYSKELATFTAVTTRSITRGLLPLVWVCEGVSRLAAGRTRQPVLTREEFASLAELAPREGALRDEESRIIRNLLGLRAVRVQDIMTPRNVVFTVRADQTVADVAGRRFELPFARMPVVGDGPDDLLGLVHRYEVLRTHRAGADARTMRQLMRPLHFVPDAASVADAMRQMIERREQFFAVVDEYGGTAGVVTMEDAIETLLGAEIVDETDSVEDMRELARRRHDQSMRRLADREAEDQ